MMEDNKSTYIELTEPADDLHQHEGTNYVTPVAVAIFVVCAISGGVAAANSETLAATILGPIALLALLTACLKIMNCTTVSTECVENPLARFQFGM